MSNAKYSVERRLATQPRNRRSRSRRSSGTGWKIFFGLVQLGLFIQYWIAGLIVLGVLALIAGVAFAARRNS